MTNPNLNPSATETLLSIASVYLFGIIVSDLMLVPPAPDGQDIDDPLRPLD